MFKLAHLSDPHIGPLPRARAKELAGKRVLGWINWNRGRRDVHRMDVLQQLLVDLHAQAPDHIALTGDVVNLALPGEYPAARAFLETVGAPDFVSLRRKRPLSARANAGPCFVHVTRSRDVATARRGTSRFHCV